jgi:hypothetical protein
MYGGLFFEQSCRDLSKRPECCRIVVEREQGDGVVFGDAVLYTIFACFLSKHT